MGGIDEDDEKDGTTVVATKALIKRKKITGSSEFYRKQEDAYYWYVSFFSNNEVIKYKGFNITNSITENMACNVADQERIQQSLEKINKYKGRLQDYEDTDPYR